MRLLSLLSDVQKKFSQKQDLAKTMNEISMLEEIKMEEDSESQEDEEGSQMDDEDEEGDLLIEEEMTLSDGKKNVFNFTCFVVEMYFVLYRFVA